MCIRDSASTLRESGQTTLPMRASMIAMGINFVFNSLLIFGLFGFPALGVVGAGIATSLSRFVEFVIVVSGAHRSAERYPFMEGVFRNFHIDGNLARQVAIKGFPLLLNECLWSMSQALSLIHILLFDHPAFQRRCGHHFAGSFPRADSAGGLHPAKAVSYTHLYLLIITGGYPPLCIPSKP